MTLIDRIERALFGATAQETVDMMVELAARRAEARIAAALMPDGPEYDAVYDDALAEAQERGLDYDESHREAARIADEWKAAQARGGGEA